MTDQPISERRPALAKRPDPRSDGFRCLLVNPELPVTYWGFQESMKALGKATSQPPLGLITLAAHLPAGWRLRLVDLNVQPLSEADLHWADAVLCGGMFIQAPSMHEVIRRANSHGLLTVVGGPAPTTAPELFEQADLIFRGEIEGREDELVAAMARLFRGPSPLGQQQVVLHAPEGFPEASSMAVPRYDLLRIEQYSSMSIQTSRGCPFNCEFCDIIQLFGRRPRVKSSDQVLAELDTLFALGYRGGLFVVDDNFIGNKRAVRELLPRLALWQQARGRPFELSTEASVNLADDDALIDAFVEAGFVAVFLGIETPSLEALQEANKAQNMKLDLKTAVEKITRRGVEVMGGFIVGFDHDGPEIFEAQRRFIESSPIPMAMVGVLTALPGTPLYKRVEREGRLRDASTGDQFGRPNFVPAMGDEPLLRGYADLMATLYSPAAYFERCMNYVDLVAGDREVFGAGGRSVFAVARIIFTLGVLSRHRFYFWKLLFKAMSKGSAAVTRAVTQALLGAHLIDYTEQHLLPRLRQSLEETEQPALAKGRQPRFLPVIQAS